MAVQLKTEVRTDNRKLRGDLRKVRGMFRSTFRGVGRGIKSALGSSLGALGVGAGALGLAQIGKDVLDFEESLVRLKIQGGKAVPPIAELRDTIRDLSQTTALSRGEIAAGATELVNRLGEVDPVVLQVLATAAQATKTSMADLAGIAFKLNTALDIKSAGDLNVALGLMAIAGKTTTIPLNELSEIVQKTAPIFRKTGKAGIQAAADMTALLQVAGKFGAFGTAKEAGTGFTAFFAGLEKGSKRVKQLGGFDVFEVRDGRKQLKSIDKILNDIEGSKLATDAGLLARAFESKEAANFIEAILRNRKEYEKLRKVGHDAATVLNRDMKTLLESPAGRIKKKFNEMKEALADALTPERIEKFAGLLETLAELLGVLLDNSTAVIAVWAAFKVGGIAVQFAGMSNSISAMATSSTGMAGSWGSMAVSAGALVAAATAGVAIGTALDNLFGISDKISDLALNPEKESSGLIRQQLAQFGPLGRAQIGGTQAFGGGLSVAQQRGGSGLLREARASGAIGPGGEINKAAALALGTGTTAQQASTNLSNRPTESRADLERITRALEFVVAQEKKGAFVKVLVSVDPNGKLKAEVSEANKARRSPG